MITTAKMVSSCRMRVSMRAWQSQGSWFATGRSQYRFKVPWWMWNVVKLYRIFFKKNHQGFFQKYFESVPQKFTDISSEVLLGILSQIFRRISSCIIPGISPQFASEIALGTLVKKSFQIFSKPFWNLHRYHLEYF